MQSGQVNASQLLASFLGSVKAKLGRSITNNDFSGELARHLPKETQAAQLDPIDTAGLVSPDGPTTETKACATAASAQAESKSGTPLSLREKSLPNANAKMTGKSLREVAAKNLVVSNPAIVQTVLAKLNYSAEKRDECEKLLNKQGHISIQDLSSILNSGRDAGGQSAGQVPVAAVRTLVESIVGSSDGERQNGGAAVKGKEPAVALKPDGSYTREELSGLLKKVVKASLKDNPPAKLAKFSSQSSSTVVPETSEALKTGQTRELVSSVLPSFIFSGDKVPNVKDFGEGRGGKVVQAPDSGQNRIRGEEDAVNVASGGSDPIGGETVEQPDSSSGRVAGAASGHGTLPDGGENATRGVSVTIAATEVSDRVSTDSEGLTVEAALADGIKAGMAVRRDESLAAEAMSAAGSLKDVQNRAQLGGQDTPMLAKHIEKSVGGREQSSEGVVLKRAEANPGEQLITMPQMENSSPEGFVFYDRNQSAEFIKNGRDTTPSEAVSSGQTDNIVTILNSYISSEDGAVSTADGNNLTSGSGASSAEHISNSSKSGEQAAADMAARSEIDDAAGKKSIGQGSDRGGDVTQSASEMNVAGRLRAVEQFMSKGQGGVASAKQNHLTIENKAANDSAQNSAQDVSNSTKAGGRADSDEAARAKGNEIASAESIGSGTNTAASQSSSASTWSLAGQESISMAADLSGQSPLSGDGQTIDSYSGKKPSENPSNTSGVTTIAQVMSAGLGGAVAAKRAAEANVDKEPVSGPGLLQVSAPQPQAINMPLADNSAQNGFASYDPYRAVEMANEAREQAVGGAARGLVLQMDSEALGKINLKVQAKKGEISVEALTQNEPARQALMSHTVQLREDLRTQGLVLEKFMVDVGGGNPGGKNGDETHQPGNKRGGVSKTAEVRAAKTSEAPVQAAAPAGGARLSIFA